MTFEEKVVGGAVPKNFFPAVEKGLKEACEKGVLAGYPMVFVKATLLDGSSSSWRFFGNGVQTGSGPWHIKKGIPQAGPAHFGADWFAEGYDSRFHDG